MSVPFHPSERVVLGKLADVLIPACGGFPSASEAGVSGELLDQLLCARPDLLDPIQRVLSVAINCSAADAITVLKQKDPDAYAALTEWVPGAYFLSSQVRAQLGYPGQTKRPINPRTDEMDRTLLEPVVARGAIYRPTPGTEPAAPIDPVHSMLPRYDIHESYDWNFEHAPDVVPHVEAPVPGQWQYCGLPVRSPLGIAAGPLLNGKWILYYAALGFDILTYKTVRSRSRASYPMPNLQPVEAWHFRGQMPVVPPTDSMLGSWAVSFGMPSKDPEFWRRDIEATRRALPKGKLLAVSVVATPEPHWTLEDVADDFARCATWAVESGADCVEANFSCPNVNSADGQLYQQPESARRVAARLREAIGRVPLLIKVGHIRDGAAAGELCRAVAPSAAALVMVNCISATVAAPDQPPLFNGEKRGIAGAAIRSATLEQLRMFAAIVRAERLDLRLIGVGGIETATHVCEFLEAGADSVQLATAAMLEPSIGIRMRESLARMIH